MNGPGPVPLLLMALAMATGTARAQAPALSIGASSIEIGGRVHTQLNTTSGDGVPATDLLLRRVRLSVDVQVNDLVGGKIVPDFAGGDVALTDAYVRLSFSPGAELLAGRSFRPFSRLEQTSSNGMPFVERGLRLRGVAGAEQYALMHGFDYSDRALGVQLRGEPAGAPLGLGYGAGIFEGPEHGVGGEDSYQYAARATVAPLAGVSVGLGWSSREFARTDGLGSFERLDRGSALEADVAIGSVARGPRLVSEVAWGDADPAVGESFLGAQAWLSYRVPAPGRIAAVEPVMRLSYGRLDGSSLDAGGTLLTPGMNLWLGGSNRLMVDYDFWNPSHDGGVEHGLKAMLIVAF